MVDSARNPCPFCGSANDDDALFCGVCGRGLQGAVEKDTGQQWAPPTKLPEQVAPDSGRPRANTNPGFNDPSTSPGFGGPTLLDAPALPPQGAPGAPQPEPVTDDSTAPMSPAKPTKPGPVQTPTLMSDTPLRGSGEENGGKAQTSPLAAFGGPTLKEAPSLPSLQKQAAAEKPTKEVQPEAAEAKDAPGYGGPTLMEAPAFSIDQLQANTDKGADAAAATPAGVPAAGEAQAQAQQPAATPPAVSPPAAARASVPPLSTEARALLERFGGGEQPGAEEAVSRAPVKTAGEPGAADLAPATHQGVGAAPAPVSTAPSVLADGTTGPVTDTERTMMGMPVPDGVRESAVPPGAGPAVTDGEDETQRGLPSPRDPSGPAPAAAAPRFVEGALPGNPATAPADGEDDGMTMLGVPSPAKRPSDPAPDAPPPAPFGGDYTGSESLEPPKRKRRGWGIAVVIVLALLIGGAAVAAGAMIVLQGEPFSISSETVVQGDRLRVTLTVEPAAAGARIRFAEQEQPLVNGQASFDLSSEGLPLGPNELPVSIVEADGSESSTTVRFNRSYQAAADLNGLKARVPYYTVRFQVAQGAKLEVASQPVALAAGGAYVHKIPLKAALAGSVDAGDSIVHRVPFSVKVAGQPDVSSSVDTSIPRTRLRVHSPTEDTVVDRDSVLCAGQTEPGAEVTINGTKVPAASGSFTHTVPLATVGEHPVKVVAVASGKAPRTARFKVRRATTLAPLIQAFAATVDETLDFERINRDPEAVRGRPVRFRGRVLTLDRSSRPGRTLLQVLVEEGCRQQGRCSLYVTYSGSTELTTFTRVTIYGVVSGQWEGQTQGGERLVMPAIQARFIVADQTNRGR